MAFNVSKIVCMVFNPMMLGKILSNNFPAFTVDNKELKVYFWLEKTDIRHGIILPISIWPIYRLDIGILRRRTKFQFSSFNRSWDTKGFQNS